MNCLHCGREVYRRTDFAGNRVWEHEHNGCTTCDDMQHHAEPDVAELVVGFCRKMNELSNVGRQESK